MPAKPSPPVLLQKAVAALLARPGRTPSGLRRAVEAYAARRSGGDRPAAEVPAVWAPYVDKVVSHAYRITDEEVARLRAAGCDEDEIFEITLAAAVGASLARLERGLAAIEEANRASVDP